MEGFLAEWGYLALYVATTLEGEFAYLSAIVAAKLGHLTIWGVAIAGFLGGMTRDMAIFMIARYSGQKYLSKNPDMVPKLEKASKWLSTRPPYFLAFHRFIYGLSTATVVTLALSKMTNARFTALCVLACFTWVLGYGLLGYFAADQVMSNLEWIKDNTLLFIGIILAIILIIRWIVKMKKA